MRKQWIIVMVMIILLFVACSKEQPATQKSNKESSISEETNSGMVGEPLPTIALRSLEELREMRGMINCEDEEKLYQYLRSIEGGGADTREDLAEFLAVIDEIPILSLIEGEIIYLEHFNPKKLRENEQKRYNDEVHICTEAVNEDATRITYRRFGGNIPQRISNIAKNSRNEVAIYEKPVEFEKQKLILYGEEKIIREEEGKVIYVWYGDFNGIFTEIIYHTKNFEPIDMQRFFNAATISVGIEFLK